MTLVVFDPRLEGQLAGACRTGDVLHAIEGHQVRVGNIATAAARSRIPDVIPMLLAPSEISLRST